MADASDAKQRSIAHDRAMHTDIAPAPPATGSAAWARTFARIYGPTLWPGERRGMRALRRTLLANARGRTLEIGAGTGLNLAHYPDGLDELVVAEPDPAMRRRLERKVHEIGRDARVIDAPAEQLPYADGSLDTVVSTLVLCTVDNPDLVLRELTRVLRPDGQLLLIEHVRSESPRLARWQDRCERPWQAFARGCRCNRATSQLLAAHGLSLTELHSTTWKAMPPIVRPLVVGRVEIGAAR